MFPILSLDEQEQAQLLRCCERVVDASNEAAKVARRAGNEADCRVSWDQILDTTYRLEEELLIRLAVSNTRFLLLIPCLTGVR